MDDPRLDALIARIPDDYLQIIEVGPGWYDIIAELDQSISILFPDYILYQVKQKFGGLRYYTNVDSSKAVADRIFLAEERAHHTCEKCGSTRKDWNTERGYSYCYDCHNPSPT